MALSLYRGVLLGQRLIFSSSSLGSLAASLHNVAFMDVRGGLGANTIHLVSYPKLSRGSTIVRPYPTSPHLFFPTHYNPELAKILGNQYYYINAECDSSGGHLNPFFPVKCLASTRGWIGMLNPNDESLILHRPSLDHYVKDDVRLPAVPLFPFMKGGPEYMGFQVLGGMSVRNLVLSAEPDEESCILMAVLDEFNPKLAFCRPGLDVSEWTILHGSNPSGEQLVYSEPRATFYTLSAHYGGIEAWDFSDPRSPKKSPFIYKSIPLPPELSESEKLLRRNCKNKSYLVVDEPSGDLLLVVKYYDYDMPLHVSIMVPKFRENEHEVKVFSCLGILVPSRPQKCRENEYEQEVFKYGAQRYDVYKVDFAGESLKYLNSLTNRVIFLGFNHSFCLTTKRHPHLIPETIYFADDFPEEYDHGNYPQVKHLAGIYHYAKHRIGPFPPFESPKPIREPTFWVAPGSSERPNLIEDPWGADLSEEMKRKMHME